MIAIIDYGLGNTLAFANIFKRLNIRASICSHPDQFEGVKKIVLPGVGSFDWAVNLLNNSGLRDLLDYLVLEQKIPVIGVCVGMQIMANGSEEGLGEGLGWIDAEVKRFDISRFNKSQKPSVPHMGWNDIETVKSHPLLKGLDSSAKFYFLHSYYFLENDSELILARSQYGYKFTSIANKENVFGVQFHPEKSHQWGIRLLKNFAELSI